MGSISPSACTVVTCAPSTKVSRHTMAGEAPRSMRHSLRTWWRAVRTKTGGEEAGGGRGADSPPPSPSSWLEEEGEEGEGEGAGEHGGFGGKCGVIRRMEDTD